MKIFKYNLYVFLLFSCIDAYSFEHLNAPICENINENYQSLRASAISAACSTEGKNLGLAILNSLDSDFNFSDSKSSCMPIAQSSDSLIIGASTQTDSLKVAQRNKSLCNPRSYCECIKANATSKEKDAITQQKDLFFDFAMNDNKEYYLETFAKQLSIEKKTTILNTLRNKTDLNCKPEDVQFHKILESASCSDYAKSNILKTMNSLANKTHDESKCNNGPTGPNGKIICDGDFYSQIMSLNPNAKASDLNQVFKSMDDVFLTGFTELLDRDHSVKSSEIAAYKNKDLNQEDIDSLFNLLDAFAESGVSNLRDGNIPRLYSENTKVKNSIDRFKSILDINVLAVDSIERISFSIFRASESAREAFSDDHFFLHLGKVLQEVIPNAVNDMSDFTKNRDSYREIIRDGITGLTSINAHQNSCDSLSEALTQICTYMEKDINSPGRKFVDNQFPDMDAYPNNTYVTEVQLFEYKLANYLELNNIDGINVGLISCNVDNIFPRMDSETCENNPECNAKQRISDQYLFDQFDIEYNIPEFASKFQNPGFIGSSRISENSLIRNGGLDKNYIDNRLESTSGRPNEDLINSYANDAGSSYIAPSKRNESNSFSKRYSRAQITSLEISEFQEVLSPRIAQNSPTDFDTSPVKTISKSLGTLLDTPSGVDTYFSAPDREVISTARNIVERSSFLNSSDSKEQQTANTRLLNLLEKLQNQNQKYERLLAQRSSPEVTADRGRSEKLQAEIDRLKSEIQTTSNDLTSVSRSIVNNAVPVSRQLATRALSSGASFARPQRGNIPVTTPSSGGGASIGLPSTSSAAASRLGSRATAGSTQGIGKTTVGSDGQIRLTAIETRAANLDVVTVSNGEIDSIPAEIRSKIESTNEPVKCQTNEGELCGFFVKADDGEIKRLDSLEEYETFLLETKGPLAQRNIATSPAIESLGDLKKVDQETIEEREDFSAGFIDLLLAPLTK